VPIPNQLFVRLTVSAAEAPKVTQISISERCRTLSGDRAYGMCFPIDLCIPSYSGRSNGQLADMPARGLDKSRTRQLADWSTRDDAGNRKPHKILLINFFIVISITNFTRTRHIEEQVIHSKRLIIFKVPTET